MPMSMLSGVDDLRTTAMRVRAGVPSGTGRVPPASEEGRGDRLRDSSVLVVEDEFFSALQLESILAHVGCSVIGPFSSVTEALTAAREEMLDAALLDVSVSGELVYPLADALRARGVLLVFVTGHRGADLPERFRDCPRVVKPYNARELVRVLRELVLDSLERHDPGEGT